MGLVLVTGPARSGTSLVTGLLATMGFFTGHTVPAHQANPRGFFENAVIREKIVKPAIAACGADPRCQGKLPPRDLSIPRLRERVWRTFADQGWDGYAPCVLKCIKGLLFWPCWAEAFPQATWVHCQRPDEAVIASCQRTSFMDGRRGPTAWREWLAAFRSAAADLTRAAYVIPIDVDALVSGDAQALPALCRVYGRDWNHKAERQFILPEAWHAYPLPT